MPGRQNSPTRILRLAQPSRPETTPPSPLHSGSSPKSLTARETTKTLPSVPQLPRPHRSPPEFRAAVPLFPPKQTQSYFHFPPAPQPPALPTRKIPARCDPQPARAPSAAPSPPGKPPPIHKQVAGPLVEIHILRIALQ